MGLRDCTFEITYGPSDDRLRDFYIPALSVSVNYDRAAGYWTSKSLAMAATGVARLIQNGGHMRLLVGAQLEEADVQAIVHGAPLAERIEERLTNDLTPPADAIEQQRLEALAWMVANKMLEIRVVMPRDADGHPIPATQSRDYYHPKEGLFTDATGDMIAFSGSVNETGAWERNYEQFSVYFSWNATKPYLTGVRSRFERLWANEEEDWIGLPLPDAVEQKLLKYCPAAPPTRDPLEKDDTPPTRDDADALQRERIIFQFLRDAPAFANADTLSLGTCTVEPWPHQRQVVRHVVERFPERFLLCDEVGLGKTIEAGLILRHLLLTQHVQRCLLLVPRGVASQWQDELYEKFSLNIPFYDGSRFVDVFDTPTQPDRHNPWMTCPIFLASSQLAKRVERQAQLLQAEPWDLIIVDEAHHARRKDFLVRQYRPNRLMQLLETLEHRTRGLLLLTATPMQVDPLEVWDLLRLLHVGGRWAGVEDDFLKYFRTLRNPEFTDIDWNLVLAMIREYLDSGGDIDPAFARMAETELGPVDWQRIRDLPHSFKPEGVLRNLTTTGRFMLKKFAQRHTPLHGSLFRNTRHLLREYHRRGLLTESIPTRDPRPVWIDMRPEDEQKLYDRIEEYITDFYQKYEDERTGLGFVMTVYRRRLTSSFYAMERSLERRLRFLRGDEKEGERQGLTEEEFEQDDLVLDVTEEVLEGERRIFQDEIAYVEDFLQDLRQLHHDTKAETLETELRDIFRKRDKVIVFTQYTDTLDYLRDRLRGVYGTQIACYSGRGGERWDGVRWAETTKEAIKTEFRTGEGIKILLCTEAAAEGLNLQTCGVLINYDMPWNPMRVEQRIGRIDRIGQVHDTVWIHHYFYSGTVEAEVYRRLEHRIGWFQAVVGELQPILAGMARVTERLAMTPKDERQTRLNLELERLNDAIQKLEVQGLDIDTFAESEIDERTEPAPPVPLQQLETTIRNCKAITRLFEPISDLTGAYTLHWGGTEYEVTFNRDLFDQHPDRLRLLTYGEPLLDDLLASRGEPETRTAGRLVKTTIPGPTPLIGYYTIDNGKAVPVETLDALHEALKNPAAPEADTAWVDDARKDIEVRDRERRKHAVRIVDDQRKKHFSAIKAQARDCLRKAAIINLIQNRNLTLFPDQEQQFIPLNFTEDAVLKLADLGVPFRPLLSKIPAEEVPLSPQDPYYRECLELRSNRLATRADQVKKHAMAVLEQLVAVERSVGGGSGHLAESDIECAFLW